MWQIFNIHVVGKKMARYCRKLVIYQLLYFGSSPNLYAASGYIWGHNFGTNWNLGPLSISKWLSEPQLCERWRYIWQKTGQKQSYKSYLWLTFISKQSLVKFHFMESLNSTATSKKFEFLCPFSRPLRNLKKSCFALNNQRCFAFQIQILTTKVL